jgi:RNA polymerase sigma-70 factor (ECF subfamily)
VTLHSEFETLLHSYQHSITAYLCNLLGDEERGQELAQETFLRAYRALARGLRVDHPRAWLYRIATNVAKDEFRRARLIKWLPFQSVEHEPALQVPDAADCVAEQLLVRSALAKLSPDYRVPLLLHLGEGLSTNEIAEVLNLSQGAVKMRLSRAREQFRCALQNGLESSPEDEER